MSRNEPKKSLSKREAYLAARLEHPGWSKRRLAESVGISESQAKRYEADPDFRTQVAADHEEARLIVKRARRKAAQALVELLKSTREGVRLQAIKMILGEVVEPNAGEEEDAIRELSSAPTPDVIAAGIRKARGEG